MSLRYYWLVVVLLIWMVFAMASLLSVSLGKI